MKFSLPISLLILLLTIGCKSNWDSTKSNADTIFFVAHMDPVDSLNPTKRDTTFDYSIADTILLRSLGSEDKGGVIFPVNERIGDGYHPAFLIDKELNKIWFKNEADLVGFMSQHNYQMKWKSNPDFTWVYTFVHKK